MGPGEASAGLERKGHRFLEAAGALLSPHIEMLSNKQGEARTLAICLLNTTIIAVVYTVRRQYLPHHHGMGCKAQ
jgi:uncharacterized DUF497 family protein